jgi:hypothetical protein
MLWQMHSLMQLRAPNCSGLSKALKTPSEFVSLVLASIIPPLEISWVEMPRRVDKLYINMMYVLATAQGEIHPPKTPDRIEIALDPNLVTAIREQTLTDALAIADAGFPIAPGFLRAGGREQQAMLAETLLAQQLATVPPPQKNVRRKMKPTWDVDAIVDERGKGRNLEYLVRWEGYHPSWEAYRPADWEGEVGEPIQTWEPARLMKGTEALEIWDSSA